MECAIGNRNDPLRACARARESASLVKQHDRNDETSAPDFPPAGESKGYGLIKYLSSDASAQARHLLDGRLVGSSHNIVCHWLNSSHITFASLHSKALYVDCLPKNYGNNGEFKKIFSVEKVPSFCMVSSNGAPAPALPFVLENNGRVEKRSDK